MCANSMAMNRTIDAMKVGGVPRVSGFTHVICRDCFRICLFDIASVIAIVRYLEYLHSRELCCRSPHHLATSSAVFEA
jgi:hypothetical protein